MNMWTRIWGKAGTARGLGAGCVAVSVALACGGGCGANNSNGGPGGDVPAPLPHADEASLQATGIDVSYVPELDAVVFEMSTKGDAGSVAPTPVGQVDGAPVLGYVFLTNLSGADVGFGSAEGTVALAVTSHPDFDDTPLWDEDGNAACDDDGVVYHSHWVLLVEDDRAPAGLAAKQAGPDAVLPPTAPMPMYLDSPGFTVVEDGQTLRVVVPADRMNRRLTTKVGGAVAYMEVDASGETPLLAVHGLLSQVEDGAVDRAIGGTDGSLSATWPAATSSIPDSLVSSFDIEAAEANYHGAYDSFVLSMSIAGDAGSLMPVAAGQTDGAPVLGYVFPTTIPPAAVGFTDAQGTLALAVTSHPDFDDTPLWDETLDKDYGNDGGRYHVHWAVLSEDTGSAAGLSVVSEADKSKLPPTAPMPMLLDSPGYHAFVRNGAVHVVVPGWHLRGVDSFSFDAVTARMQVDASGPGPVLRVQRVYEVLSGDLSLPLKATR